MNILYDCSPSLLDHLKDWLEKFGIRGKEISGDHWLSSFEASKETLPASLDNDFSPTLHQPFDPLPGGVSQPLSVFELPMKRSTTLSAF